MNTQRTLSAEYTASLKEAARLRKRTIHAYVTPEGWERSTIHREMIPHNVSHWTFLKDGTVLGPIGLQDRIENFLKGE